MAQINDPVVIERILDFVNNDTVDVDGIRGVLKEYQSSDKLASDTNKLTVGVYKRFNKFDIINGKTDLVISGIWSGDTGSLDADHMHTSSVELSSSISDYYYNIYNKESDTDEISGSAELQFAVAYGHVYGSGSEILNRDYPDALLCSKANYSYYKSLLLDPDIQKFQFENSNGILQDADSIYAITLSRPLYRERLQPDNWQLSLNQVPEGEIPTVIGFEPLDDILVPYSTSFEDIPHHGQATLILSNGARPLVNVDSWSFDISTGYEPIIPGDYLIYSEWYDILDMPGLDSGSVRLEYTASVEGLTFDYEAIPPTYVNYGIVEGDIDHFSGSVTVYLSNGTTDTISVSNWTSSLDVPYNANTPGVYPFYTYDYILPTGVSEANRIPIIYDVILRTDTPAEFEISFEDDNTIQFYYSGSWQTYGIVSGQGGTKWLDRNLGSIRVAETIDDEGAFGDLYQWGRFRDGHERRTSLITGSLSETIIPTHDKFITGSGNWVEEDNDNLWQPGSRINIPAPNGWRVPTREELNAERVSWSTNDINGAFASVLKLPNVSHRYWSDGVVGGDTNSHSGYWSSTKEGANNVRALYITNSGANLSGAFPSRGYAVRLVKSPIPVPLNDFEILEETDSKITFSYDGKWETFNIVEGANGTRWLDRNLGASQVATSKTDILSYGHLYQWGRFKDGHQRRFSLTTSQQTYSNTPGHDKFITNDTDWRSIRNDDLWQEDSRTNIPAPPGWRLPTEYELSNEIESWSTKTADGAFDSILKWSLNGIRRETGIIDMVGDTASIFTSDIDFSETIVDRRGTQFIISFGRVNVMLIDSSKGEVTTTNRSSAAGIRLIKDDSSTLMSGMNYKNLQVLTYTPPPYTFIDDSSVSPNKKIFKVVEGYLQMGHESGSFIESTTSPNEGYGYGSVYPEHGIIILNPLAIADRLDQPLLQGFTNDTAEHRNQQYLISAIRAGNSFIATRREDIASREFLVWLTNREFNYSNNPTYITNGRFTISEFERNPKTYITTIGLYNDNNELLAIAKTSKPIETSFDKEVLIKIRLLF
jgi:hypothetical protein